MFNHNAYTSCEYNLLTFDFYELGIRREYPLPSIPDLDAYCNGRLVWIEEIDGVPFEIPRAAFRDIRLVVYRDMQKVSSRRIYVN